MAGSGTGSASAVDGDEAPVPAPAAKRTRPSLLVEAHLHAAPSERVVVEAEPTDTVAKLRLFICKALRRLDVQVDASLHLAASGAALPLDAVLHSVLADGAVVSVKIATASTVAAPGLSLNCCLSVPLRSPCHCLHAARGACPLVCRPFYECHQSSKNP